jgi:crotonobetainyl-CoA:carnitine CoA-transferase CaiB-like acyl-CoA transferase
VLPLSGHRVLACENGLAGPLCTRLLADLGADVVKIERPGSGDVTRAWDTGAKGLATGFVWMNRGKRSVALDLKEPAARRALDLLLARSDVFFQNFAPGWAERMGLDEPAVRRMRSDIVYAEITGYGSEGPYAHKNAYDLVVQGEAGLITMTGTPEEPARISIPVADIGAGSYAAVGTLAALLRRAESGAGERVSVSLFDVMLDWIGYYPHFWWHRGEEPGRWGLRHPLFCPYGPYRAARGRFFNLAVLSSEHWRLFCEHVIERPELLADERFASVEGRAANRDELEPVLEPLFREREAEEWVESLEAVQIPCGLVREFHEVMEHPQLAVNGLVTQIGSEVGVIPTIGNPILLAGDRTELGPVPALGEHTREVLEEAGLSDAEIDWLADHEGGERAGPGSRSGTSEI